MVPSRELGRQLRLAYPTEATQDMDLLALIVL